MLEEEIKKGKGMNKLSPFTNGSTHSSHSDADETFDKLSDLSLKGSSSQRTPTRPPINIKGAGKVASSLPSSGFFSHSMPIRPVIGSLPGPAASLDMPTLNLHHQSLDLLQFIYHLVTAIKTNKESRCPEV